MITMLAPYFAPAIEAGGPIKSVGGVCRIIKNDCEYTVITRNRDIDGSLLSPEQYEENVVYNNTVSIALLRKHFRQSTLIWLNTLHSVPFSIKPLLALFFLRKKTVLISPRGQLLYGAISFKKKIYLQIYAFFLKLTGHHIVIHYTHNDEKDGSYGVFRNYENVTFANPIPGTIHPKSITENSNSTFVIGFFGRITPKKNIGFIIELLPLLDDRISLEIHGALEDKEYVEKLKQMIEALKVSHRVSFCGHYDKDSYIEKARGVDTILIPSLSENFCHVFFEAIEMRKIVIASSGLPWEDANATVPGTILPLEQELWVERINEVSSLSKEAYEEQQEKQIAYYHHVRTSVELETLANFKKLS